MGSTTVMVTGRRRRWLCCDGSLSHGQRTVEEVGVAGTERVQPFFCRLLPSLPFSHTCIMRPVFTLGHWGLPHVEKTFRLRSGLCDPCPHRHQIEASARIQPQWICSWITSTILKKGNNGSPTALQGDVRILPTQGGLHGAAGDGQGCRACNLPRTRLVLPLPSVLCGDILAVTFVPIMEGLYSLIL